MIEPAPPIESVLEQVLRPEELAQRAERANIRASAAHLRHGSRVLEPRIAAGSLVIAGAEYCLESGVVGLFDGVPYPARQPGGAGARLPAEKPLWRNLAGEVGLPVVTGRK